MVIIIIIREKWLSCLYHLPCAQRCTKHPNVLSQLIFSVLLGGRFSFCLCFADKKTKQNKNGSSESLSNFLGHTVRKWQSRDAEAASAPKSHRLGKERVLVMLKPRVRGWESPHVCKCRDAGSEQPAPDVRWIHSKHSIMSVYLLLLFTALFPKWIVCLSKEHLPLLQSLVNKIIFAFPQICMSLISLAIHIQEPVQETHSWTHTSTPGKKPSQTNTIRIK